MNNMNVTVKILIGFAVIEMLLIVSGIISYTGILKVQDEFHDKIVQVSENPDSIEEVNNEFDKRIKVTSLLVLNIVVIGMMLCTMISFLLARSISNPLKLMRETLENIAEGRQVSPISVKALSNPNMAGNENDLLRIIRAVNRIIEKEKDSTGSIL